MAGRVSHRTWKRNQDKNEGVGDFATVPWYGAGALGLPWSVPRFQSCLVTGGWSDCPEASGATLASPLHKHSCWRNMVCWLENEILDYGFKLDSLNLGFLEDRILTIVTASQVVARVKYNDGGGT